MMSRKRYPFGYGWDETIYVARLGRHMKASEAAGLQPLIGPARVETEPDCFMDNPEDQARVEQYARARGQELGRLAATQEEEPQPPELWADIDAEGAMMAPSARPEDGQQYFWPDDPARYKELFVAAFLEGYQEGYQEGCQQGDK